MEFYIQQGTFTTSLKQEIVKSFNDHSIAAKGINGHAEDPVSFEIINNDNFIAALVVQYLCGQLHIKYLIVDEKYRGIGLAKNLMWHAFSWGKSRGCSFAYVETMNFQAPKFYQKLGFKIEFERKGYAKGTTFYYLCKNLQEENAITIGSFENH